ncbi:MAG: ADP-heptose:LPS heptosyltransferase II [Deltaproteobacteria bacterium ADurb.Bin022]|jgi:hypothetical protein|nr:MAG: ADP-heptose:LPS heptosyltransferase II [Deltaproteobacteria bacterium ADurb.Bin022]
MTTFKKIGILWGGGLGDLLVLRPFLKAVHAKPEIDSYLLTTATHSTELFEELCSPSKVILLKREGRHILRQIRNWYGFFDLVYLGPYPTFKTRLLGDLIAPGKLWCRINHTKSAFLLEQICSDTIALGLADGYNNRVFSTFLPWNISRTANPFENYEKFIVLHPGAKEKWETTCWPIENWKRLIQRILEETTFSITIVGTVKEASKIQMICNSFSASDRQRIKSYLSRPLKDIASLIASSTGVVCHNSGILHLSTLLEMKTVCITGSSAKYWRPDYPWVINVTSDACKLACNKYRCPIPFYNAKCIANITVDDVWKKFIFSF